MSKKFEIPWVIARERVEDEDYNAAYNGARKHGKHLRKAEDDLMVARDLAKTLRGFLGETHIGECFTANTVVDLIEKRIDKAHQRLDRHGTRHNNLFVAYFDLKAEGGAK